MSRRLVWALGLCTAALSLALWLLLDGLAWPARSFTVVLLGPLQVLMLLQGRMINGIPADAEREAVYVSSALTVWLLAGLAMLAARFGGIAREELRLVELPVGTLLLAAGATVAAGVAIMAVGKLVRVPESDMLGYLIPRNGSERIAFTGLSISAGIAEELVYRSFLIPVIAAASGSLAAGAAVSVAAFAITHAYQGLLGVLRVALLGLVLTVPFLLTGSVYPSMVAHAALDILAGLVLADSLLADGD